MSLFAPKRASLPLRILICFLALVLGLATGLGIFAYQLLKSLPYVPIPEKDGRTGQLRQTPAMLNRAKEMGVYIDSEEPLLVKAQKEADYVHILVYGLDSRGAEAEDPGRSDAMILLSLDRRHHKLKLTSLMRDSRVSYSGGSNEGKLNAAYVYGGVGLLLNTINETLDLDVRHYIQFNWDTTEKLVDALGGVRVDISQDELAAINENIPEQAALHGKEPGPYFLQQAGQQRLNGMQALAWARVRKVGNDQGRTSRQRQLMEALIHEFNGASMLRKLGGIRRALPLLVTNISTGDILSWLLKGNLRPYPVSQYRVPEDGLYTSSADTAWDLVIDWEAQRQAFWNFMHEGGQK